MQRINVVVVNPLFLGVFIGSAVLSAACIVTAFLPWNAPRSPLADEPARRTVPPVFYLAGTFLVTMALNVPRNNRLARLASQSSEAASFWPIYVREWSTWNHVRTAAAIASAACSAVALSL